MRKYEKFLGKSFFLRVSQLSGLDKSIPYYLQVGAFSETQKNLKGMSLNQLLWI